MDTIDQTRAYEPSHAYPVSQATLFDALLNAAVLKDIWGVSSITVDATPQNLCRVCGAPIKHTGIYCRLCNAQGIEGVLRLEGC
jgi:hypothetical protein